MNILIITATYTPSTNGVAICTAIQKKELEKLGHTVYVLAPKHSKSTPEKNLIRLPSLHNPKEPDYPILVPVPNKDFFDLIPKKIDLVYYQHPFMIAELAFLASKYYKCPTVFYYHTQYEEYAKSYLPKFLSKKFVNTTILKSLKKAFAKTNHIIVGSETFAKKVKSLAPNTAYTIIPITRKAPKLTSAKKDHKPKVALCIARLSKEKNINTLIAIWKKLSPQGWQLQIAGSGPDMDRYKKAAGLAVNNNQIVFLGNIPHDQIWELYQQADLFVFPSKSDVQPGVIFEAMSCQLPIVAFNAPGPADFTKHQTNSFLAKNNREFVDYLSLLLSNKVLRRKMSLASLKLSQGYKLETSINKLEELFLTLRAKKGSSTA